MVTKTVNVNQVVEVTVDEDKFTPVFMTEFRENMYPFTSLDDHIEHLAQLYARGVVDAFSTFIEGYGPPEDMGIECTITGGDTEVMRKV